MKDRRVYYIICLVYIFLWLVLTVCFKNLPFYGDQIALISHPANLFFDNNFTNLIVPDDYNTGHPPLLPALFAVAWKCFGRSLEVSHWLMFFCMVLLIVTYLKLCNEFIPEKKLWIPALLFFLHPALLTQTLGMSADVFLLLFFLMGVHAILKQKKILLILCCALLSLTNLRGMIYIAVLAFVQLLQVENISIKNVIKTIGLFFIAVLPFAAWNIFHFTQSGWFIMHAESPWAPHRKLQTFTGLIQNAGVYLFRSLEAGFFIVWMIILYFIRKSRKQIPVFLLRIFIFLILFTCIFFLPNQNPILKRYFLGIECITLIILSYLIYESYKPGYVVLTCFVFISSHFFIYPDKLNSSLGYSWDATLAGTPYFQLREEALIYLEQQATEDVIVSAGFPMYQSYYDTNLQHTHQTAIQKFYAEDSDAFDYFIYSNTMNEIPLDVRAKIETEWKVVWQKQKGKVEMLIYKNIHRSKSPDSSQIMSISSKSN